MSDFSPLSTLSRFTGAAAGKRPANLGRFELKQILGKGAQSVVWLAFDPRLERQVAIKVMRVDAGTDAESVTRWLQEARSVSRLTHPNIVPVFEADLQEQQPYLVFEYVPGETLADYMVRQGALAPREAVAIMTDVLDGLCAAHAAGIVHRDLKPSNILIDKGGRARVMDFGIAARTTQSGKPGDPDAYCGTPGYISPEAVKGASPAVTMDVFAAGVVLTEALAGVRLINDADPYRALYRVTHEDMVLPESLGVAVDDRLRAVLRRAMARDPVQRFPTAQLMLDELQQWAAPVHASTAPMPLAEAGKGGNASSGTLEFLLRRMRHKSDFPALSDSVMRIQSIANSEKESVGSLTNEILKDVALTNKLLRLVNSALYGQGGNISTVSRAVTLVGFNGIRNMALSLVMLDHMHDKAHANILKEEYLRSLMAGSIGGQLCPVMRESEEAFIGAMFQNLGRLLSEFYFPEEAQAVRALVTAKKQPLTEAQASVSVLGLSYAELGLGVAQAWGLPVGIRQCMNKPGDDPPARVAHDAAERLRWVAAAANDIADTLLHQEPKAAQVRIVGIAKRYARVLGVGVEEVQAATVKAREKLIELAHAMELKLPAGSRAEKLLTLAQDTDEKGVPVESALEATLSSHELHATHTEARASEVPARAAASRVGEVLAAGIQDITNAMVDDFKLSDVLRMILETMYRAMDFKRIIFCMRDVKTETLTGRFGLGDDVNQYVKSFMVGLKGATPDLFTAVCIKGADTMISDATEGRIAERLPVWYRKGLNAPTFLLLPLHIKGAPFGLIYADKLVPGGLVLDEKELALLRTLRNQAIMAFRQSN